MGGCISAAGSVSATVNALPTITPGSNPTVCAGTTSANLLYSATTGSPDQYSIVFDATAHAAGFADVTLASLSGGNITITVPGAAAVGTYNGTLTVKNSTTGCVSGNYAITVTVSAGPTTVAGNGGPYCPGATIQLYATGGSGDSYSWTGPNSFSSAAQNPTVSSASAAKAGIYHVTRTIAGCGTSPDATTTVAVNSTPATPSPGNDGPICAGGTLHLSANTTADSYNWTGPNGLTLTAQNPSITTATTAATGTYNLTVTVNGCPFGGWHDHGHGQCADDYPGGEPGGLCRGDECEPGLQCHHSKPGPIQHRV